MSSSGPPTVAQLQKELRQLTISNAKSFSYELLGTVSFLGNRQICVPGYPPVLNDDYETIPIAYQDLTEEAAAEKIRKEGLEDESFDLPPVPETSGSPTAASPPTDSKPKKEHSQPPLHFEKLVATLRYSKPDLKLSDYHIIGDRYILRAIDEVDGPWGRFNTFDSFSFVIRKYGTMLVLVSDDGEAEFEGDKNAPVSDLKEGEEGNNGSKNEEEDEESYESEDEDEGPAFTYEGLIFEKKLTTAPYPSDFNMAFVDVTIMVGTIPLRVLMACEVDCCLVGTKTLGMKDYGISSDGHSDPDLYCPYEVHSTGLVVRKPIEPELAPKLSLKDLGEIKMYGKMDDAFQSHMAGINTIIHGLNIKFFKRCTHNLKHFTHECRCSGIHTRFYNQRFLRVMQKVLLMGQRMKNGDTYYFGRSAGATEIDRFAKLRDNRPWFGFQPHPDCDLQ